MIALHSSDKHAFDAYRADPEGPPKGAIVVIHDTLGVDAGIRKISDNFAAQGYVAIAPSLLDRAKSASETQANDGETEKLIRRIDMTEALADIQAAIEAVKDAGKVAIIGYGWGGALGYHAGNHIDQLVCAVAYCGEGILEDAAEKRKIPTLLHFPENDPSAAPASLEQFRAHRPDVSVFAYAAGHKFNDDAGPDYSPDEAAKAQTRTLAWISQYVEGAAPAIMKNAGAYAAAKVDKKKKPAA